MLPEDQLFILSEAALTKVVDQIKDDQWSLPVPKEISAKGGTLREIINYHAYDDAWVPEMLAGKTIAEVGKKYDGDLLGANPKQSWHAIVDKAVTAVKNAKDLTQPVHMSYGDFPAQEYLVHISMFRGMRAIDLAKFIGVDAQLEPELLQGLWDHLSPHAAEWRQMGVFGPEIRVPADAPLQQRLLGLTGRQPV